MDDFDIVNNWWFWKPTKRSEACIAVSSSLPSPWLLLSHLSKVVVVINHNRDHAQNHYDHHNDHDHQWIVHLHQIKRKLCLLHKETAKLCQLFRIFHLEEQFVKISTQRAKMIQNIPWHIFALHFCQKVQASPPVHSGILQASCLVEQRLDCRVSLENVHVYQTLNDDDDDYHDFSKVHDW